MKSRNLMMKFVATTAALLYVMSVLTEATSLKSVDPKDIANIGGRRYYFSTVPLNVPEAITLCKELNMTLAGFETEDEYNAVNLYLINTLERTDLHWTSGNRQHTSWVWSNSGEPFTFFKWNVGQPDITDDGSSQQGLCVTNGVMHDVWPRASYRFICEEKLSC